jgi:hypothetical protein
LAKVVAQWSDGAQDEAKSATQTRVRKSRKSYEFRRTQIYQTMRLTHLSS